MKPRLKLLLSIFIFVFLYAIYYWVVPLVVDIDGKIPFIQGYLKKEFGARVEIENPNFKMGLSPSIWLEASRLSVLDGKENPLDIKNPKLKIRLMPLIIGRLQPAFFSCDKISANLKIDKEGRLYIGRYLFMKTSNPKLSLENSKMDVNSYDIRINDEQNLKKILLNGAYFNLAKYNSKKYVSFSTNSKLKINDQFSVINADVSFKLPLEKSFDANDILFDGTVTNLDLSNLSPYIKKFSNGQIVKIGGKLNAEADTRPIIMGNKQISVQIALDKPFLLLKNIPQPIFFDGKLNIYAMGDVFKNAVDIKKLKILSKRIDLDLSGNIKKIDTKNPRLNLLLKIKNTRSEDLIAFCPSIPAKTKEEINFIALKKYGYYSDVNGQLSIKGKSDKPELFGDFISTNGYVVRPLNIPKATVKMKFLGKKMQLDVVVPTSNVEKVFVKGLSELYGKKETILDISSTKNVDLHTTEIILNPLHEILLFDIGPVPIMSLQGQGNIKLKAVGTKKEPRLFGAFNFKNTTASFNGINAQIKNGEGSLYFNNLDTHFVTRKAFIDSKPMKIDGKCSLMGVLDFDVTANNQNISFLMNIIDTSEMLKDIKKQIPAVEKLDGKINLAFKLKGKVADIADFKLGDNIYVSGSVKLLGNSITFSQLKITVNNLFGNIKFDRNNADFDLYSVVERSKIAIKGKIRNGVLSLKMRLDDVRFTYLDVPINIFSGNVEIHNNKLFLYKINAILDSMPVLIDGTVSDIFKHSNFDLYVNSKPTQRFIDKNINKNTTYPLKVKGDIIYSARVSGTKEALFAKAEISLAEDSSIYYMGSTIGDVNNPIRIYLDTKIAKNSILVQNFQYDKLISSQNDKGFVSPQINAKGQIVFNNNAVSLHNFRIKTQNPTDAKIFNILFKKPLIKQGLFSSNVLINESVSSPKIQGFLNFTGIDIPLLDTTLKDISMEFGENDVDIKAKGEVFSNRIVAFATMKNNLTPPYSLRDVDIYLGNLDINEIMKTVNKLQFEPESKGMATQNEGQIDVSNLIISNAKVKADSVLVKNIFAKNLKADFSLNEKLLFSIDDFKFDIAQGKVNGTLKYNLLTANSALDMHAQDVNANAVSEALFDLQNQIYGTMTGDVNLTCNGKNHKSCMNTLTGRGGFKVTNGKMPKLGSLEYLLKASNLMRSGITGVTINGVIDLLTPLKTGEFQTINGSFDIDSGIAQTVQIFSKGKDLSLFIKGTYNFSTLIADMKVFGRLSKKVTNGLGAVGNTSLNTLFNLIPGLNLDATSRAEFVKQFDKIPGFEFNDKMYRVFSAEIYGDINGDNYVQSFKWVD